MKPNCSVPRCVWPTVLLGWMALLTAPGCGYSPEPAFPAEYQSVAVPVFENRSFLRGIEFDITEALIKEIELRTPYKHVDTGSAQTLLTGTVVRVQQTILNRTAETGLPQEVEVTVTIDFAWRDLRTGEVIRERKGFEVPGRYIPAQGVDQTFGQGKFDAAQNLARQVVAVMREDW